VPAEDRRFPMPNGPSTDQSPRGCCEHIGARPRERRSSKLGSDGYQLDRRVRAIPADHCIFAKSPEGSRQLRHQAFNLSRGLSSCTRESAVVCLTKSLAISLSRPAPP
jgi:hypothetical protein